MSRAAFSYHSPLCRGATEVAETRVHERPRQSEHEYVVQGDVLLTTPCAELWLHMCHHSYHTAWLLRDRSYSFLMLGGGAPNPFCGIPIGETMRLGNMEDSRLEAHYYISSLDWRVLRGFASERSRGWRIAEVSYCQIPYITHCTQGRGALPTPKSAALRPVYRGCLYFVMIRNPPRRHTVVF